MAFFYYGERSLLIANVSEGEIVKDSTGNRPAVICNLEFMWKKPKEA